MTEKKAPLLIALDGPVGAGKSSLADEVARRLHILHLDTGAMYRALGLAALERGIDIQDEEAVSALGEQVALSVRFEDGRQVTLLDGRPVDDHIRTQEVGNAASTVSRYQRVRRRMVQAQQAIAREQSMIIDGRDIGTVVLPHARAKVFLTATAEERARRRLNQVQDKEPGVTFERVYEELLLRDKQDQERAVDPLRQAEDAVLLDTTGYEFEQSVQAILAIVEKAYGPAN